MSPYIGTRYPGQTAHYDPESGRNYRIAVTLKPDQAVKVIRMAERAGLSVSGFLNSLVQNMEIDPETGLPPYLEVADQDTTLPYAGQEAS